MKLEFQFADWKEKKKNPPKKKKTHQNCGIQLESWTELKSLKWKCSQQLWNQRWLQVDRIGEEFD